MKTKTAVSNMDVIFEQYLENMSNMSTNEQRDFARCMVACIAGYAESDKELERKFTESYNTANVQLWQGREIRFKKQTKTL